MKKIVLCLFIVFFMLGLVACDNGENKDAIDSAASANIYGQVIYPVENSIMNTDNNMFGYAKVILDGEKSQITDCEGKFAFYNVEQGEHILKVSDEFFRSKEYKVTINKGDLTGIKLYAEVFNISTEYIYDNYDDQYEMYMNVHASDVNLDTKEVYVPDKNGDYILLGCNQYSYDVKDIFEFDKDYIIKVILKDKDSNEIRELKKTINFHKPELYTPEDKVAIDSSSLIFSWEEIDGIVQYELELYYYDEENEEWDYCDNFYTLDSHLSLELDKVLTRNGKYKWMVIAELHSETGFWLSEIVSEPRTFFYYENY